MPDQYRQFITTVGLAAGPYYGLLPFTKIRDELTIIYEDHLEAYGESGTPSDLFPYDQLLITHRDTNGKYESSLNGPQPASGFIPICHHGCEFMTVMITTGACSGMVFDTTAFATVGAKWSPAGRPPGIVESQSQFKRLPGFPAWPTFGDWISGWLEQCFSDLGATMA